MMRILNHLRANIVGYLALFVALGGTSYAAFSLPAGSVGAPQLRDRAITASKLNPASVAASVRAWARLTWDGGWRVTASSSDIHVTTAGLGEDVSWRHTHFPSNCLASVTPQRNFAPGGPGGTGRLDGYVSTFFDARSAHLQIDGIASDGTPQAQSVTILVICPTAGSQKLGR
jgi:hypothetical protein